MDASNLSPLILCAFGVTVMGFVSRLYFGAPGAREHLSYLTTRWRAYTLRLRQVGEQTVHGRGGPKVPAEPSSRTQRGAPWS